MSVYTFFISNIRQCYKAFSFYNLNVNLESPMPLKCAIVLIANFIIIASSMPILLSRLNNL